MSGSISESPVDFEITRVDCMLRNEDDGILKINQSSV